MGYSPMSGKDVNAASSSQKNSADSIKQIKADCIKKIVQLAKNAPQYLTQADMLTLQRKIGNRAVAQLLENGVVQRHLYIDAPDNDFRKLNDLGMWWAMSCEWKGKTNELGDQISSDPHQYITSLLDVDTGVNNTERDEEVRMIAHGYPDSLKYNTVAGKDISINGKVVKAEKKIQEIESKMAKKFGTFDSKKLTPMHCFMGNKGGTWDKSGRGGLAEGLLLIPNGKMISIKTTENGGVAFKSAWPGGDFINAQGSWIKVAIAKSKLPKLKAYVDNQTEDNALLKEALEEIFTKIGTEYKNFAAVCNVTGEADNAWKL